MSYDPLDPTREGEIDVAAIRNDGMYGVDMLTLRAAHRVEPRKKPNPMPVVFVEPLMPGPDPENPDGYSRAYVLGKGTVHLGTFTFSQTENQHCYCYAGLAIVSFGGIANRVFLGESPFGIFCGFADIEFSAISGGPGLGVQWKVWEGGTTSLRWDILQRRFSLMTTVHLAFPGFLFIPPH